MTKQEDKATFAELLAELSDDEKQFVAYCISLLLEENRTRAHGPEGE